MRRFWALMRTAAVESLAEPLTAVLFLSGLLTIHLASVFHYHRFGEAGRLARECGFSVLLVFGLIFATAAAGKVIGGEIARGTAAVALATAVSRPFFLVAKTAGVLAVFFLFTGATVCATALAQNSATVAGLLISEHGDGLLSWGPGLAAGVGLTLLGFTLAAAANRFRRMRFCVTASLALTAAQPLALALAAAVGYGRLPPDAPSFGAVFAALLPAFITFAWGCAVFVACAAALAVRCSPALRTALVGAAIVFSFVRPLPFAFPDINRFWLVDRLAHGGAVKWAAVTPELAAGTLLILLWLVIGSLLLSRREIP